jgi:hypothetical protein
MLEKVVCIVTTGLYRVNRLILIMELHIDYIHIYQTEDKSLTERVAVAVTLRACIRELLGSNLSRNTDYLH